MGFERDLERLGENGDSVMHNRERKFTNLQRVLDERIIITAIIKGKLQPSLGWIKVKRGKVGRVITHLKCRVCNL